MKVSARHIGGDTWEVSLPKRKSAVKHRDGIRPRRLVHAASEADAVALGEAVFEREFIAYKMGVTMELADLTVHYIDHAEAEGRYSADTARDYRNMAMRYIEPNFAMDVDRVTTLDVEAFYAFLLAEGGRRGEGIGPNTIHKLNTVLRAAWSFFVREGVCAANPMPSVELPSRTHPAKRALTEREFVKVLDGLEAEIEKVPEDGAGIKWRNMMFGAYIDAYIGARVGELCALTRGKVRALEERLRIDESLSERGGMHLKAPKTDAGRRTVAVGGGPWEKLRRHYEWQATYLTDAQRDSDATPICCTAAGGFIRPSDMSAAFKEFCASVGVELAEGESIHVLRHTHATQLLSNKRNPEAVKARLGHSRIETTFEYSHVLPGEDAATAEDFSEIVERARKAGGFR